ncbi:cytoplasmic protein [Cryptococcus neoformans]|nr:cytoplasmic protein [Cryptococcus neoformans var. grubii]OXC63433.1 cytoplasmic protein [Cryptococcus neoformans var. grubii MW-RSA852]
MNPPVAERYSDMSTSSVPHPATNIPPRRSSYSQSTAYLPTNLWFGNSPTYSQILSSSIGASTDGTDPEIMKRPLDSALPISPMNGMQPHLENAPSFIDSLAPKKARYDGLDPSVAGPGHGPIGVPPLSAQRPFGAPGAAPGVGQYNTHAASSFGGPASGSVNMGGVNQQQEHGGMNQAQQGANIPGMQQGASFGMMGMGGFGMGFPFNVGMQQSFHGAPIVSPSMNPNTMTGNYGPAAAAAAAAAAGNTTGRTVYVGNLPAEASVDELLNLVRFGPIEAVRLLPEKSCVFISFLDGSTAAAFHADACVKKLALHGQELKIGWGKPSMVHPAVATAVASSQATRNVFVGNLDPETNEQDLRNELSRFGPIDQVKIVRDKNIGFIHFLSISTAMKVVGTLPTEQGWEGKRVNYGKDRCAYVPKAQQDAVRQAQTQAMNAIAAQHQQATGSPFPAFSPMSAGFSNFPTPGPNTGFGSPAFAGNNFSPVVPGFTENGGMNQAGNRTIYLGNIHQDVTIEELCNHIRGGILHQVRYFPDKHIAFVTFVDPVAAMQFHQHAHATGLSIMQRRLKVGWGKHSGPVPPALLQAIQAGASRNVYIGQIADFSLFTEEKLRQDFGEFGEIDMINFLNEKGVAFVNFTSIQSAQKAIEGIKLKPEYSTLRISYGKDRCANPPRTTAGRPPMPHAGHESDPAIQIDNSAIEPGLYDENDAMLSYE